MSIKGKAYIAGIYEHPTRKATDLSVAQLHGEVAAGALADAGISKEDIGISTPPMSAARPMSCISVMPQRRAPWANATSPW